MILSQKNPSAISGLIGNPEALSTAKKWAEEWQAYGATGSKSTGTGAGQEGAKTKPGAPPKPLLAYGPVGVGKTALAHAIASEFGWQLFEFNASDLRDAESVERILSNAVSSSSLFGTRKLILIDDVDALSGREDRGGAGAMARVLSSPPQPIILTAHNLYDRKLLSIRGYCTPVEFRRVHAASLAKLVRETAKQHNIDLPPDALEKIAAASLGDVRAALNDLQGRNPHAFRDSEKGIFDVIRIILKSERYSEARNAVFSADTDHDALKLWVAHNIPAEYEKPFDIAGAYDALSRADIFDGRIKRNQYYGYLRYSNDLLSAGVALAKASPYHKYSPFGFPDYLREMGASKGSRATRKGVLRKIAAICHCSPYQAQDYLWLLEQEAKKDATAISGLFGFGEEEIAFVGKTKLKKEPAAKKEGAAGKEYGAVKKEKAAPSKKKAAPKKKLAEKLS